MQHFWCAQLQIAWWTWTPAGTTEVQPGHPRVHSLTANLHHPSAIDVTLWQKKSFGWREGGLVGKTTGKSHQEKRVTQPLSQHPDQAFHCTEWKKERPLFSTTYPRLSSSGSLNLESDPQMPECRKTGKITQEMDQDKEEGQGLVLPEVMGLPNTGTQFLWHSTPQGSEVQPGEIKEMTITPGFW